MLAARIFWRYKTIMSTIDSAKKPTKGRPPVDSEAVNVRIEKAGLTRIDDWRRNRSDLPSRPEAIRRLVELGIVAYREGAHVAVALDDYADQLPEEVRVFLVRFKAAISGV